MKATYGLVLAEIAAFVIASFYDSSGVFSYLGFSSSGFFQGQVWTLVTSMFVHVDVFHLASNLFFLLIFGPALEESIGPTRTVAMFAAGGILSLVAGLPFYSSETRIVGSSLAVSTLVGASLVDVELDRPSSPALLNAPLGLVALIYVIFNGFMFVYDPSGDTAWASHVIGFFIGVVLGAVSIPAKRRMTATRKVSAAVRLVLRSDRPRRGGLIPLRKTAAATRIRNAASCNAKGGIWPKAMCPPGGNCTSWVESFALRDLASTMRARAF